MVKGVILADFTAQGRRGIKESPNRAEAAIAEAKKLGVNVKDLYYTPGGPHDAAMIIEAEGPEPIHKFIGECSVVRQCENEICPDFLDRRDAEDALASDQPQSFQRPQAWTD